MTQKYLRRLTAINNDTHTQKIENKQHIWGETS